jgi:hypothetical protein
VKLSVQTLLKGVVDYAGLFPPAGLDMASSIRNYGDYISGVYAWALGRFIVPLPRLEEFNFHMASYMAEEREKRLKLEERGEPWQLSALADGDLKTDLERIKRFNGWHGERDETLRVVIDAIEVKVGSGEAIAGTGETSPDSLRVFFEVPVDGDPDELLSAIARTGGAAKVRTGGVTHEMVPAAQALIRFLDACLRYGVRFKATGGLHHPLYNVRALTYDPASPKSAMHGFLNLLLSAAFMYDGMKPEDALAVATEQSAEAFLFDDDGVEWRGHRLTVDTLAAVRRDFAVSFGSSSFEGPMEELRRLDLYARS